ncbi:DUF5947 family protein [Antrihabitans cavernicola]|uniref:Uncharacterized protein n=1 Tax=Antrihabitans cavernicola TaxID=2495913 RepID=A0A5A7SA90_9NOCA|nr:DUF5947 family protein [Spelaeibacter cavernicola]KAA0022209.1 hypothetical protein FOY51_14550 [Spelaeibacter cavernicola]
MTQQTGSPLEVLRRLTANRPPPVVGERCEMCAEPIGDEHAHVVGLQARQLMCVCRGCYLLFTDQGAQLRYRSVPERYLAFPDFELAPGQWDALEIPVGLAFFFENSTIGKTVAFYPGPAGATESELPLSAWNSVTAANPLIAQAVADVEALLVRVPERDGDPECYLVPIDACYRLVGQLRSVWRGFDGGSDAQREIDGFFDTVRSRSRVAT